MSGARPQPLIGPARSLGTETQNWVQISQLDPGVSPCTELALGHALPLYENSNNKEKAALVAASADASNWPAGEAVEAGKFQANAQPGRRTR